MPIIVSRGGMAAEKIHESGVSHEAYLQGFVSSNPDSLPIEDIKEDVQLLVIGQEFDTASGPIDVLAVDKDGDIYIIETKLFRNPDKRRVIAQVLDYGAALWGDHADPSIFIGHIDDFMMRRRGNGFSIEAAEFLDAEDEVEDFIGKVKACYSNGAFRFVILMDKLDERLKQLIVFMNSRTNFNIYAVEMEFYRHDDLEIVIPKLFGAESKKAVTGTSQKPQRWDQARFLEDVSARNGEAVAQVAKEILDWASTLTSEIKWGTGKESGSFQPAIRVNDRPITLFYLSSRGTIFFGTKAFVDYAGFGRTTQLEELRERLNRIPGIDLGTEQMGGTWTPELSLSHLEPPDALELLKETVNWLIQELAV